MKRKEKLDIFNLSFLDIISCGFGAVVLLVLISNNSQTSSPEEIVEIESLLFQVTSLEESINNLNEEIDKQDKKNDEQLAESGALHKANDILSKQLGTILQEENSLDGDLAGLSLVEESLKRISIAPSSTKTTRDAEVGGIPVDSDYVIFVVDTSGSMQAIWGRVSREIINVLTIHPQVTGFQILSDQGAPLISGYSGRWIPDTPQRRKAAMRIFSNWAAVSNSSPVQGVETALRKYTKQGQSTSIYVFGDDYTGSSFDATIATLTRINNGGGSNRRAKIHGVGFLSEHTTNRFSVLMRELARRNGGTFLALPIR